jgi:hypothetical protein
MGDKLCLVTIATEASVTIVIPAIATGLPERDLTTPYVPQMASGDPHDTDVSFSKTDWSGAQ